MGLISRAGKMLLLTCMAAYAASGCASAISKEVRQRVDHSVTIKKLLKDPDAYHGSLVMFGGAIVETVNTKEGARLIVMHHPSDSRGRPRELDRSGGRFIAEGSGFLDEALYKPGRLITVAGVVKGGRSLPLGETSYHYPVLQIEELHLWRPGSFLGISFGFGFYHQF